MDLARRPKNIDSEGMAGAKPITIDAQASAAVIHLSIPPTRAPPRTAA